MKKAALPLVWITLFLSHSLFAGEADLEPILDGSQRSPENRNRDIYRHPAETLKFFDVEPDMTVVEIWPSTGWYSEILAPLLKQRGTFYAAHFPKESPVEFFNRVREGFQMKMDGDAANYGKVIMAEFNPGADVLSVPEGSADRVLTFRNVHNWLRTGSEERAFALFYKVLKPGGRLGVVEHRTKADRDRAWMLDNGYMTENYVIGLAEKAGFRLAERSEINANAADTADHPEGVWTLPPTLRLGDVDKKRYLAIGESDRMTLLFIKPLE